MEQGSATMTETTGQSDNPLRTTSSREGRWRLPVVAVLMTALAVAHFTSPPHDVALHDFLFKATYLPIALAALWYGRRGGLGAAIITSAVYTIHIRWQLAGHAHAQAGFWVELVLYFLIGITVGWLSDRQRQSQTALEKANRHLAESLASLREKTEALLVAEASLERAERLRSVGELAASVAHEIRNPLGGILGAAQILAKTDTPETQRVEFADVLTRETQRLDRVVTSLLDLARPHTDGSGDASVRDELEGVRRLTMGTFARKSAAFDLGHVAATLRARITPDALRQVLLNLTLNSLAALPASGGRVDWSAQAQGDSVAIEVADTGGGIDQQIRDRMFEPFVTSGASAGNTGLGLSIVRRLVEESDGSVALVSTGASGTVFRVTLPSAERTG